MMHVHKLEQTANKLNAQAYKLQNRLCMTHVQRMHKQSIHGRDRGMH
jgi:hypothetical protein